MNKQSRIYILVMTIGLLVSSLTVEAQSRKRLRELEKLEEEHQVDEEAATAEAKERHMSIQSKGTRKQMKRYKKLNKRHNKNRRPIFRFRKRRR